MAKKATHTTLQPRHLFVSITDLLFPLAKTRLINVRLISMAMTGFFYTFKRPRTSLPMGMLKYDPIGTPTILKHYLPFARVIAAGHMLIYTITVRKKVLFLETKKRSK
ncbi:hypothetical protein Golomagni_06889 [Golovinomyces magnicellulatus]|nr:hypothetical protein Golomagni_06889 [Golovinomyces magnicellulatus]